MSDAILNEVESIYYGRNKKISNINNGGLAGIAAQVKNLDAAASLILPPAVPIVIHVPTMYDPWPDLQQFITDLMETHATSITGVDVGYTTETDDRPGGADGQTIATPTQTKRKAVSPSMTFPELNGSPIWTILTQWQHDIQHPDTNIFCARMTNPPPFIPSSYSMSLLLIQFGVSHRPDDILMANYITNIFPTDVGDYGLEMNIGASKRMERTVQFTGYGIQNNMVTELAYEIASKLQIHKGDFNRLSPEYNKVMDSISKSGIVRQLDSIPKIQE